MVAVRLRLSCPRRENGQLPRHAVCPLPRPPAWSSWGDGGPQRRRSGPPRAGADRRALAWESGAGTRREGRSGWLGAAERAGPRDFASPPTRAGSAELRGKFLGRVPSRSVKGCAATGGEVRSAGEQGCRRGRPLPRGHLDEALKSDAPVAGGTRKESSGVVSDSKGN